MKYQLHKILNAAALAFFVLLSATGSITYVEGGCLVRGGVLFDDSSEDVLEQSDNNIPRPIHSIMCNNADQCSPVLRDYSALQRTMRMEIEQISSQLKNTKMTDSRVSGIKRSQTSFCGSNGDQRYCSLCPWREREDINVSRTPAIVWKAECLSGDCDFNPINLGQTTNSRLNLFTTCEEIRRDVRIITNDGEEFLEDWPIACMCTRRHVAIGSDIIVTAGSAGIMPSILFDTDETNADIQNSESEDYLPLHDDTLRHLARRTIRHQQRHQQRQQKPCWHNSNN